MLNAPFMRFYFKIHSLVPNFESSTTTEMSIRYNCCKRLQGRGKNLLLPGKNPLCADTQRVEGLLRPLDPLPPLATPLKGVI